MATIANNKKAFHNYSILEKFECGISLKGTEVKSLRCNGCNFKESFVRIQNGEVYLYKMHIKPYEFGNINNVDPDRTRKLLMHKNEIRKLAAKIDQQGFTLVPINIYFKDRRVKLEIGLAQGKKLHDKRADIAKKTTDRQIQRELKNRS